MTINQLTWVWSGWVGAPGYTSFYVQGTDDTAIQDAVNAQRAFFQAIRGEFPTEITIAGPATYRRLNEVTGDLVSIGPIAVPPASVTGGGNPGFAGPAGAVVNWLTNAFGAHRGIVGRSFLVPLSAGAYQGDGTLVDADRIAIQNAAAALVVATASDFVIWRRPVDGAGGSLAEVVAARTSDTVAVLKSRRK